MRKARHPFGPDDPNRRVVSMLRPQTTDTPGTEAVGTRTWLIP